MVPETFEVQFIGAAGEEFLCLPPWVRERFVAVLGRLGRSETPRTSGQRWFIEELRQRRRRIPGGVFSVHVGPVDRGIFVRAGPLLKVIAFGAHIPDDDIYGRLIRVRDVLSGETSNRL